MASARRGITVPTAAPLPGSLRIPPAHPAVLKALLRLSRPALLSLVQEWLRARNQSTCGPVLGERDTDVDLPYDSVQTLEELREIYAELQGRKGGKREVVDRILEGDWRDGLSLRQMAMLDVQYLLDRQSSQRWTARRIARITQASEKEEGEAAAAPLDADQPLPRFHGRVFVSNLQQQLGSMLKAHYYLTHLRSLPVSLLRICVQESPYNTQAALNARGGTAGFKTIFLAFPDHSNFVYIATTAQQGPSLGSATDIRKLVIDATSSALSSRQGRYSLKSTSLSARSLQALVSLRGPACTNAASGGWSIFAEGTVEPSPLAPATGIAAGSPEDNGENEARVDSKRKRPFIAIDDHEPLRKRRRDVAQKRFGNSARPDDNKGIDRVDLRLENAFSRSQKRQPLVSRDANSPSKSSRPRKGLDAAGTDDGGGEDESDKWRPRVEITFHGTHVFAGIRALVESGAVDGVAMPGWMTGENGISTGVVRDGLVRGQKGAGY